MTMVHKCCCDCCDCAPLTTADLFERGACIFFAIAMFVVLVFVLDHFERKRKH